MRTTLLASRSALHLWRRITAAALFALQLAVAFSPLAEAQQSAPPSVHVHDQRTQHALSHDEANCALCAARTQIAKAAVPPAQLTDVAFGADVAVELEIGRASCRERV